MPVIEAIGNSVVSFTSAVLVRLFRSGVPEETLLNVVAQLRKINPYSAKYENLVMLLGIGGVGKTTLVKRVTHNPEADNSVETTSAFRLYSTTREVIVDDPRNGSEKREKIFLGFADYRGQNIGTLLRGITASKVMKPTSINTVVLVVDLFPADRVLANGKFINLRGEVAQSHPDVARIKENDRFWSEELLQAMLGMLDGSALQKIIIFINKVDLVKSQDGRNSSSSLYQPLINRVKKFSDSSDVELEVILGSFESGNNFFALEESLKNSAVVR
ncbi:MAG: hypothetical protein ABJI96_20615 [Paracoccaceae bacterium]